MKFYQIFLTCLTLFFFSCSHKPQQKESMDSSMEKEDTDGKEQAQNKDKSRVGLDLNVTRKVLSNGLRVLIVENPKLPIFSYYTFFDVGGRYEKKGFTGATHFLEHLMFKGAKRYGPGKFDTIIEGNGGRTNAYTTFDSTVYYQSLPKKHLKTIIDMESDRMENLLLEPYTFESERQVILEERKLRYENSPRGKLYLTMMKAMFEKTPYGGSVIGDAEDVKSLTRDGVRTFFKQFYAPNNAVLVIVGDVKAQQTLKWIKEFYGPLKASNEMVDLKAGLDDPELYRHRGRYKREVKINAQSPIPSFMLSFPGVKLGSKKGFVLDMLSSILGDGESSYLYKKYVLGKRPLLNSISAANYTLRYNGTFFISGTLLNKVSLKKVKRDLLRDLGRVCQKGLTERSLQKTKNQYLLQMYKGVQTNSGIASFIGNREHYYGDYNFYKEELKIYQSIQLEDVKRECDALFKKNDYIFLSVWNKHPKKR